MNCTSLAQRICHSLLQSQTPHEVPLRGSVSSLSFRPAVIPAIATIHIRILIKPATDCMQRLLQLGWGGEE